MKFAKLSKVKVNCEVVCVPKHYAIKTCKGNGGKVLHISYFLH